MQIAIKNASIVANIGIVIAKIKGLLAPLLVAYGGFYFPFPFPFDCLPQLLSPAASVRASPSSSVSNPLFTSIFLAWATQLTYWPWFFQSTSVAGPAQLHALATFCSPEQPY